MKPEQLNDALNLLDDQMIQETDNLRRQAKKRKNISRHNGWKAMEALVACVCLLLIGGLFFDHFLEKPVFPPDNHQTDDFRESDSTSAESASDPGKESSRAGETAPTLANQSTAAETEIEPPELPLLSFTEPLNMGSGFGEILHRNVSQIVSLSPWSEEITPETLPVYRNLYYTEDFIGYGYSRDKMTERMTSIINALGVEMPEFSYTEAESYSAARLTASMPVGDIVIESDGDITIAFSDLTLPEEYRITDDMTEEAAAAAFDRLIGRFTALLGFAEPEGVIQPEYNYLGEFRPMYYVYDSAGMLAEKLLNYRFNHAWFSFDANGNLKLIRISNGLCCAEKLGDYPIIPVDQAREQLLKGNYFYSGSRDFRVFEENITAVELTYRRGEMPEEIIPYYCFYVKCPDQIFREDADPDLIEGLTFYQRCYVPAVEEEFMANELKYNGVSGSIAD